MENTDKHIEFYKKLDSPFKKSEDELWANIMSKTEQKPKAKILSLHSNILRYAAAAVILILIGVPSLMKFYTKTVISKNGEHLSHKLPDGSKVSLNAKTSLSYHPYWWRFNRKIELKGEAFFEVQKGKRFTVSSNNGTTEVLGTSFNIYARDTDYKVFCKTGKVKVSNLASTLIIKPGKIAIFNSKTKAGVIKTSSSENILGWRESKFVFKSILVNKVLEELERQYDVTINLNIKRNSSMLYTGFFTKKSSIESSLTFVCRSFNLKFRKVNDKEFIIYQSKSKN